MKQVHVVGLGLNHIDLPLSTSQVIKEAEFLVGGERLLDVFKDHPAEKIP
ncbi:MAG: bifunctional cobalt-precorrin-7 (C(5))-methyltransferase/cobalt-precorrin-6B (C(15))-methyltransferase, partial [Deltaproteobacteria bacterium]|nr:bifunctional cobalt-precorrin-7 (C(5))-methyltransferase/cobalt-precorrin-6B (C(15))-methyltransferase [Deltaproteobacteria bacterium]